MGSRGFLASRAFESAPLGPSSTAYAAATRASVGPARDLARLPARAARARAFSFPRASSAAARRPLQPLSPPSRARGERAAVDVTSRVFFGATATAPSRARTNRSPARHRGASLLPGSRAAPSSFAFRARAPGAPRVSALGVGVARHRAKSLTRSRPRGPVAPRASVAVPAAAAAAGAAEVAASTTATAVAGVATNVAVTGGSFWGYFLSFLFGGVFFSTALGVAALFISIGASNVQRAWRVFQFLSSRVWALIAQTAVAVKASLQAEGEAFADRESPRGGLRGDEEGGERVASRVQSGARLLRRRRRYSRPEDGAVRHRPHDARTHRRQAGAVARAVHLRREAPEREAHDSPIRAPRVARRRCSRARDSTTSATERWLSTWTSSGCQTSRRIWTWFPRWGSRGGAGAGSVFDPRREIRRHGARPHGSPVPRRSGVRRHRVILPGSPVHLAGRQGRRRPGGEPRAVASQGGLRRDPELDQGGDALAAEACSSRRRDP